MSNFDVLQNWITSFEEVRDICTEEIGKEYDDLKKDFYELKAKVASNKKMSDVEDGDFLVIIKNYWKRYMFEKCGKLDSKIETKKIRGRNSYIKKIVDCRRDGEKDLPIEDYYGLYYRMKAIEKDIDEDISVEHRANGIAWKWFIIGIIVSMFGIGVSILIWYFPRK